MAVKEPKIKQIQLPDGEHYIAAKAVLDADDHEHTWEDITALVSAGFTIEVPWSVNDSDMTTEPSAAKLATVPAGVKVYWGQSTVHEAVGTMSADTEGADRHIYLVYGGHSHGEKDNYDEYVVSTSSGAKSWEKIGHTDIDLSGYALKTEAGKAGTYTSTGPLSDQTGEAGAATLTTTTEAAYTATGTATVTYSKSAAQTGSSGNTGAAANTGAAGGATVDFSKASFTGDATTLSTTQDSVELASHSYQPEGTVSKPSISLTATTSTFATSIKDVSSAGAHTHSVSVDTHKHGTAVTAVTGVTAAELGGTTSFNTDAIKSASLTGTTTFNTDAIKAASLTGTKTFLTAAVGSVSVASSTATTDTNRMMTAATVSSTGVLSFNFGKISTTGSTSTGTVGITTTAATSGTVGITTTAASKGTVTISGGTASGTATVAGATSATTITATAASAGGHTHTVTINTAPINNVTGAALSAAPVFTGTTATISHSFVETTPTTISIAYTPSGAISGTQSIAAHSHSYTAPAAHTHSIALTTTTITGTAAVDIDSHSHTVTVANHTHTLGNHTHSTTIPAID